MITANNSFSINSSYYNWFGLKACEINGSKFILFNEPINNPGQLKIELSGHNIIFLAPIEARNNITIRAISVIALDTITAKEGMISISATGKCVFVGSNTVKSQLDNVIKARKGVFNVPIETEHHQILVDGFNRGITKRQASTIVDGLANLFDAIDDPNGEKTTSDINLKDALTFFHIPLTTPNPS